MTRLLAATVIVALTLAVGVRAQAPAPATPAPSAAPATTAPATTPPPTAPPAGQPTLRDDRESIDAGMKWLALIDADKAGDAWDLSSKQLKSAVTRAKFIEGIRDSRKSLGKLETRTAERFARSHKMPGAPEGDYVIIEYTAQFARGQKLQEQLVWAIDDGDIWRVAGYYYR
jgi:Protein of unknown function (DUF4019)